MLIFNNKAKLNGYLSSFLSNNKTVGFVPTMGALHDGHLSLLKQSVSENDITVISIFVNPTQFNNTEDLEKYPRNLETDTEKIKSVSPEIVIFAPSVEEMYHGNTTSSSFSFNGLENQMEGKHRPGHFNGVGTIVKRLFEIVKPTKAYFGEKDFQQLVIIKNLVNQEQIPVLVVGCPIFREENGLAMSSRNERLTGNEKQKAGIIYKTLKEVQKMFATATLTEISAFVENTFKNIPDFKLEYFEIADEAQLLPITVKDTKKYRAFIAVFVNNIRLIDNISLN